MVVARFAHPSSELHIADSWYDATALEDLLGPESLNRRGFFRNEYVGRLRQGQNDSNETRRRRLGERLWTLAMLEAWLRVFIDGRGKRPGPQPEA